MKLRYFIVAIFIHFFLFFGFSKTITSPKSTKSGENIEKITVNLTVTTKGNSNKTLPKMTTKKNIEKKREKTKVTEIKRKKEVGKKQKIIPTSNKKIVESSTPPPTKNKTVGKVENDKNLVKIENGRYALKNQKVPGIKIVIQKEIQPEYPELALKMGDRKKTIVKVKFLVDENGNVGDMEFYTTSKYGFEKEVEKALKKWKFKPIIYNGKPTPIYFYKIFNFIPK